MEQVWDLSKEGVKARMKEALEGRELAWLADELPEAYKNVQRWVTGPTAPPYDFIPRFCNATGVSVEWLLTGTGMKHPPDPDEAQRAVQEIGSIIDRIRDQREASRRFEETR